jgi:TRAP-type C4-dicarboxylate transport system permease small subunit
LVTGGALLAGVLIVAACLVICYEVAARYLLGAPTTWSIDISSYLMLWATFLGSAYTLREGGHVAVDLLLRWLHAGQRRALDLAIHAAIALFTALVVWQGAVACSEAYRFGEVTMSVLRFPLYLPLLAIPVGGSLLLLQAVLALVDGWRGTREPPRGGPIT